MMQAFARETVERARAYNMLIGYYLGLANKAKTEEEKAEWYNLANTHATDATSSLSGNIHASNYAAKGLVLLQEKKFDRALANMDAALQTDEKCVPALLGRASLHYHSGEYQDALRLFSKVLVVHPSCPPSVRYGMGLCYVKLGNTKKARLCFERVLQLESNADALVGLAVLELNSTKEDRVILAMNHLKKAYQIQPNHPMVLNHLSNHFFFRGDFEKVEKLARSAFDNSNVNEMKAESLYYMARNYHQNHDFDKAQQAYNQISTIFAPSNTLGNFGLGQMAIAKGDTDKAISHFEKVATKSPENFETQKILGSLYARKGQLEKALVHLKNAHALMKHDEEVLIEMGQIQVENSRVALEHFLAAEKILKDRNQAVPYELLNNIGVLQLKFNKDEGFKILLQALEVAGVSLDNFKSEHISVVMNIARHFEVSDPKSAHDIYINIIKKHPAHLEAYIRLATLAYQAGNFKEAMGWCNIGKEIDPKDTTPWFTLGLFYLKNKEWGKAQEMFENIISSIDKKDTLTTLGMGNIYFSFVRPDMKDKEQKYSKYASDNFEAILNRDPDNIVAAVGLGAIVAEQGYLDAAKEIFTKCREVTSAYPEIYINLGHINFCLKQYGQAIKMYEECLSKFYDNKDVDVLIYLARVYFETEEFEKCKTQLERALKIDPENQMVQYNLAIIQHNLCVKVLKDKKRIVERAEFALAEVTNARAIFKKLSATTGIYAAKSKPQLEYSKETAKLARQFLDDTTVKAKYEDENQQKLIEQQELLLKEQEEKALKEKEMKRIDAEEKHKRLLEEQRRFAQIQKDWKEKSSKPFIKDDDDEVVFEGKAKPSPRKRKTKKEKREVRKKKKKDGEVEEDHSQPLSQQDDDSEHEVEFSEPQQDNDVDESNTTEGDQSVVAETGAIETVPTAEN